MFLIAEGVTLVYQFPWGGGFHCPALKESLMLYYNDEILCDIVHSCRWKRHMSNPSTPDKYSACSTRAWQGQIRVWRRLLHKYDPLPTSGEGGQCFTAQDAALCNV